MHSIWFNGLFLIFSLVLRHRLTCAQPPTSVNVDTVEVESGNANEFIDEAIDHWKAYLRESGYDPLHVSSFTKDIITCSSCRIDGLSTLHRTGDVTLNASSTFLVVDLSFGLQSLSADCQCQAKWSVFNVQGQLTATISNYNLVGRIEQDSSLGHSPTLSRLAIANEGELETYFRGNGLIGTLVQWFGQDMIRSKIRFLLSDPNEISKYLNQSLRQVDLRRILTVFN